MEERLKLTLQIVQMKRTNKTIMSSMDTKIHNMRKEKCFYSHEIYLSNFTISFIVSLYEYIAFKTQ